MLPPAGPVRAVVVGGVACGESDRVIHLLTAHGRVAAFAPAGRASRRRFGGALETFSTIEATLQARRGRGGMPALKEATVLYSRLPLRRDLDRIALGAYLSELSGAVAPEGDAAAPVLDWLELGLDALAERGASGALRAAFQLGLLVRLGYLPMLEDRCAACGGPLPKAYLDLERGGLFCAAHRFGAARIGPKTLSWLQAVLTQEGLKPEAGFEPEWARRAAEALAVPCDRFFLGLLGRPLKSASLLGALG